MTSSALNVFSPSEYEKLKNLLKNPEDDFHEIVSLLEKKVEESNKQLTELNEKYHSLIDGLTHVGIGIDIVSKDYEVLFQNQVLKERFGDCRGKNCYRSYMNQENPCKFCPMEEALKYNRVERTELDAADGRSYELISAPYPNQDGSIDKVAEVVIDITERKQAEMKLRESEERYKNLSNELETIIDLIPGWLFCKDKNGVVTHINQNFADSLNLEKEQIIGKTSFDLFPIEQAEDFRKDDLEVITSGEPKLNIEESADFPDGKVWAITNKAPYYNEKGDTMGIIGLSIDITERKQTEQKLKESEEKYRILTEQSLMGIFILQEGRFKYTNQAVSDINGYSVEEMLNWTEIDIAKTIYSEDLENILNRLKRSEEGDLDEHSSSIFRIITKSGKLKWMEEYNKKIIYQGEPASLVTLIDITSKIESEKKLRESENKYRHLFYHLPISISIFDSKGILVESNGVLIQRLSEYAGLDFIGKKYIDIIPHFKNSDQLLRLFKERLKAIRKGINLKPVELCLVSNSGKKIWLHWQSSRLEINNEIYFQVIIQDITEQKEAEAKLKESEEKFRNISDQSLIGIGIVQDNIVKYVNKKFADIFGYTVEDMLNWSPEEFMITVHPEDKEFVFNQVKKKQVGSEDYLENYQFRGKTKSGEIIWIENFTKTIMYEGKAADFVAFIDITERISAQQELIKLNQLKSELLRRTSHELKTPLVSIKGFSELLLEVHRDKLDALVISTLNEIKHGCLRLETLIGDILKTAELESGTIQLHKSEEDLSFMVRLCVNEIKGFLKLRDHTINLELHEKLITQFEKEQIHQVMGNLLNNAIKYTPPSGIIEIKSDIKDDFIILSIKDNGIGFTEEEKTRIFKQFGKIERYGQGMDIIAEGSGFGLFISKKIIELHGGDIWVESEGRNMGSTFYFSLPLI